MNDFMNGDVLTGECRLSYVHLLEPYAVTNSGQEPKYSVTILVPKTDTKTIQEIQRAINWATEDGVARRWNGVRPPVIQTPIADGDGRRQNGTEFSEECKGHYVFTASCKTGKGAPEVVDMNGNRLTNPRDIYSGMYGRVFVTFYAYNKAGHIGIGAYLGPVQKTKDGDPLGGGMPSAASIYGAPAGSAANVFNGAPAIPTQPAQPQAPAYGVPFGQPAQPQAPVYGVPFGQPAQVQPSPVPEIDPLTGMPFGG